MAATAASVSSDAERAACRGPSSALSWIARNRSAMGISPVGTSSRASENALAPDSLGPGADGHRRPQLLDRRAQLDVVARRGRGRGGR